MSGRKTLKSVSVEGLKPTITLTPVIEQCGEGYRIHHIKSDSISCYGRDTFVPLRHVSKQKRRIFELEEENAKLRELVKAFDWCTENTDFRSRCDECPLEQSDKLTPECEVRMRELGVENTDD